MEQCLNRLSAVVIVIFIVSGCTADMKNGKFKLNDYVKVYMVMKPSERLLEKAFNVDNFHQSEEEMAHKSLTEDEIGTGQKWNNDRYGEMFFFPGRYQQHNGKKCREFKVEWILTGIGAYKQTENGQACLNPKTKRWEWAVY